MNKITIPLSVLLFVLIVCCSSNNNGLVYPINLRCENLANPIAIDKAAPLLSWNMKSEKRGQKQSAYQIIVSDSKEKLNKNNGDFWDTGKVKSNISVNIKYEGKAL